MRMQWRLLPDPVEVDKLSPRIHSSPANKKKSPNPTQSKTHTHGMAKYAAFPAWVTSSTPTPTATPLDFALAKLHTFIEAATAAAAATSDKKCVKLCVTGDTPPNAKHS